MPVLSRKPKVFCAVPCGDFYSIQSEIIANVSDATDTNPIIVEDHARTDGLWKKIADQIDSADLFMADISSHSPNERDLEQAVEKLAVGEK